MTYIQRQKQTDKNLTHIYTKPDTYTHTQRHIQIHAGRGLPDSHQAIPYHTRHTEIHRTIHGHPHIQTEKGLIGCLTHRETDAHRDIPIHNQTYRERQIHRPKPTERATETEIHTNRDIQTDPTYRQTNNNLAYTQREPQAATH